MPQGVKIPFASIEVRWFLVGNPSEHAGVRRWFEEYAPFPRAVDLGPVEWRSRAGGQPDAYLLLPGQSDMGIKWREGTLQVKGLVAEAGLQRFCNRHEGRIQRWIKWTYSDLPPAYRGLFESQGEKGVRIAEVGKRRALRMLRFDGDDATLEVSTGTWFERGLGFEMTELEFAGDRYASVAFEAFPSDEWTNPEFVAVVERFLDGLSGYELRAVDSLSYPAWLSHVSG